MNDLTGIDTIDRLFTSADETKNHLGNATRRIFLGDGDRYIFDFNMNLGEWDQFDTDSDAWYFGTWVNKDRLRILRYVEGDVVFTQCQEAESFDREIASLCSFYGETPSLIEFDLEANREIHYYQDRSKFFIDPDRAAEALRHAKETSEGDNDGA